jgi:hypothetical protein
MGVHSLMYLGWYAAPAWHLPGDDGVIALPWIDQPFGAFTILVSVGFSYLRGR